MTLRSLSADTMIRLSESWLDRGRDRPLLEKIALVGPLLPLLEKAHRKLVALRSGAQGAKDELCRLKEEEEDLDARHDSRMRGVYEILSGVAELAESEDEAQAYHNLREMLFPAGLHVHVRDRVEKADQSKLALRRIDEAAQQRLEKISLPTCTLRAAVERWLKAMVRLGELEERRLQIEHEALGHEENPSELANARDAWAKAVQALEANLALEARPDDALLQRVLGPLRDAEEKVGGGVER